MKLISRKNNYSGMCNTGLYEIDLRTNDYVKYSPFVCSIPSNDTFKNPLLHDIYLS